jgi:hypothetical protein
MLNIGKRIMRINLLGEKIIPFFLFFLLISLSHNIGGSPGTNPGAMIPLAAPQGYDDSYETTEDTQLDVAAPGVLSNDKDEDGDELQAVENTGSSNGEYALNSDGSFRYLPNRGFTGSDKFTYIVSDGKEKGNVVNVVITVKPANTAPLGNDDRYSLEENTILNVVAPGVLKNDSDGDKDSLEALLDETTSSGTLVLKTDGSFIYTPNKGFTGTDKFTYIVSDTKEKGNTVTVAIEVEERVNTPPEANDYRYETQQNTILKVAAPGVLKNDTDKDGDTMEAILDTTTSNGKLNLYSDGSFDYEPEVGFAGTDKFSYIVSDGLNKVSTATVIIGVSKVSNPSPTARSDEYSTEQDETLHVRAKGVLQNDSDPNGDILIAVLDVTTTYGILKLYENGSFIYEPNFGYFGTDKFSYKAFDGENFSDPVMVTINIIEVEEPKPTITSESPSTKSSDPTTTPTTTPTETTPTSEPDDTSTKTEDSPISSDDGGADPALPVSVTGPTMIMILTMGLIVGINSLRRKN